MMDNKNIFTYKFLYFQGDIKADGNNVVENDEKWENVLEDVDSVPPPILSQVPVIHNLGAFFKWFILEVEAVGVSEAGAEDDLSYQDPNVDQNDLVHRLLRRAELVLAELRVHGHLGVDWVNDPIEDELRNYILLSTTSSVDSAAEDKVRVPQLGSSQSDILQTQGTRCLLAYLSPHQTALVGDISWLSSHWSSSLITVLSLVESQLSHAIKIQLKAPKAQYFFVASMLGKNL